MRFKIVKPKTQLIQFWRSLKSGALGKRLCRHGLATALRFSYANALYQRKTLRLSLNAKSIGSVFLVGANRVRLAVIGLGCR